VPVIGITLTSRGAGHRIAPAGSHGQPCGTYSYVGCLVVPPAICGLIPIALPHAPPSTSAASRPVCRSCLGGPRDITSDITIGPGGGHSALSNDPPGVCRNGPAPLLQSGGGKSTRAGDCRNWRTIQSLISRLKSSSFPGSFSRQPAWFVSPSAPPPSLALGSPKTSRLTSISLPQLQKTPAPEASPTSLPCDPLIYWLRSRPRTPAGKIFTWLSLTRKRRLQTHLDAKWISNRGD